jgi:hypothetical protein
MPKNSTVQRCPQGINPAITEVIPQTSSPSEKI